MKTTRLWKRQGKSSLHHDYRQSRVNGWKPKNALSAARTLADWRKLEWFEGMEESDTACVRLRAEYDLCYELDEEFENEKQKQEAIRLIDQLGVYGVISEYWDFEREEWIHADSIWGCAAYQNVLDPFENMYVVDLMQSAIDAAQAQVGNGVGI